MDIHGQHEFKAEFLSSSTGQTEQLQTVFTENQSAHVWEEKRISRLKSSTSLNWSY